MLNEISSEELMIRDVKKILKTLKSLDLKRQSKLYRIYELLKIDFNQKSRYNEDLLLSCSNALDTLMSIAGVDTVPELRKHLKGLKYNKTSIDYIRIAYFLLNGEELHYSEHVSNLILNKDSNLPVEVDNTISEYTNNLKTEIVSFNNRYNVQKFNLEVSFKIIAIE